MAGSADITGRQNYVLGIGHPKSTPPAESPPIAIQTNANTGDSVVLGISGKFAPLDAIFLGDSKTAQNFGPAGGVGYAPKWATLGNAALGWPFNMKNGGVSGNTTAQMLARLPALLDASAGPGWLVIRGMTNDITSGILVASNPTVGQTTKELIVANLKAMITLGRSAGKYIALCTEVGGTTGFAAPINATTAQGALMRQAYNYVNRWIRDYCAANGLVLIDIEAAVMDPATGLPVSGYMRSDGLHLSYVGSCAEAQAMFAAFNGRLPVPARSPSMRLSANNLVGPSASAAGSVTADAANDTRIIAPATAAGGIPNGWSISQFRAGGGASGSKVARGDYTPGQAAQLAFTSSASFGGAGFWIGGDPTNVLSRWDIAWAASTAYAVGRRVNANGCSYVCVTAGTTSGSDPTAGWSTQEGALVTDGAVFLCQRKPLAGEFVQAVVDLSFNTLVGNAMPRIQLVYRDTSGVDYITTLTDADLSAAEGVAGNWLPATARYVSLPLQIPNSNIRYLAVSVGLYGENGSSANMVVQRADIVNISQSAALA